MRTKTSIIKVRRSNLGRIPFQLWAKWYISQQVIDYTYYCVVGRTLDGKTTCYSEMLLRALPFPQKGGKEK